MKQRPIEELKNEPDETMVWLCSPVARELATTDGHGNASYEYFFGCDDENGEASIGYNGHTMSYEKVTLHYTHYIYASEYEAAFSGKWEDSFDETCNRCYEDGLSAGRAEQPTPARVPVQIELDAKGYTTALCNDGTIFTDHHNQHIKWKQLPPIPQPTKGGAK